MFYMRKRIGTRELLHGCKGIQAALARGESFEWTHRGRVIARIEPVRLARAERRRHDWLGRAQAVGATVGTGNEALSAVLYRDRD